MKMLFLLAFLSSCAVVQYNLTELEDCSGNKPGELVCVKSGYNHDRNIDKHTNRGGRHYDN